MEYTKQNRKLFALIRGMTCGYIDWGDGTISFFPMDYLSSRDAKYCRNAAHYIFQLARSYLPEDRKPEDIKEIYFLTEDSTKITISEVDYGREN
ncbi:MAG: hypothetical protein CSYNP_03112 [Syntrophus sp. SKADARSKE-3]|nr:hypothetical protein [Syntrophus sp. SKADARSKE-3]